jgi:hypothetical protein
LSISRTHGPFDPAGVGQAPLSEFEVKFTPLDLVAHWRRCGMTADFLAYFIAYTFENPKAALNTLSTVINELLENAVKFSANKREPVVLALNHYGETIRIETRNVCSEAVTQRFDAFLDRLFTEDIEELFIAQIEHNAATNRSESGLGLITMVKDHNAKLGVSIRPTGHDGTHEVLVQVTLNAEEVDQS